MQPLVGMMRQSSRGSMRLAPAQFKTRKRRGWKRFIAKVNDLFEGDSTDDDQLVCVNNVKKGKLLESKEWVLQASNNTKAQFANSPTLSKEIMNAVMDALAAHTTMSKQAIDSERVREGLKDVLLGPAQLYEALRERGGQEPNSSGFEVVRAERKTLCESP